MMTRQCSIDFDFSVNWYELEPLNENFCLNCHHYTLDIGESGNERRYFCYIHPDIELNTDLRRFRVNDCKDILFVGNDAVTTTFSRRNH